MPTDSFKGFRVSRDRRGGDRPVMKEKRYNIWK
ncbi:hypothetical protein AVEN_100357-1, partial [Araneus ventricosus]